MNEKNIVENIVIPENPKIIPNEVLFVYVPKASYDVPGIAKYNRKHFKISDNEISLNGYLFENGVNNNNPQMATCFSGVKGFYWTSLVNNPDGSATLKLSVKQDEETPDLDVASYGWSPGDGITIHNFYWYHDCAEIESISGNSIKVIGLPFSARKNPATSGEALNYGVFVTSIGMGVGTRRGEVSFGDGAFSAGINAHAIGSGSAAFGKNTYAIGHYSFVAGRENEGYYGCFIGGRNNKGWADYVGGSGGYGNVSYANYSHFEGKENTIEETAESGHVEGASNTLRGKWGHVEGTVNTVNNACGHAGGSNNKVHSKNGFAHGEFLETAGASDTSGNTGRNQALFGMYNKIEVDALLIVGNGTSKNRQNALSVFKDGTVKFGDKIAATKEYVENYVNETILGGEW